MSVAQRLVRKLCDHCKQKAPIDPKAFPLGFTLPKDLEHHWSAVGCNECHHTGYHGRKALYEILPVRKDLVKAIKENVLEIDDYMNEHGISSLRNNALQLVKQGTTSIEEVYALLSH